MKRWGYLFTFMSGAVFAVVLGSTSIAIKTLSVTAQQIEKVNSQKWEYCSMGQDFFVPGSFGGRGAYRAQIQYFQPEGVREEVVETERMGARAKAIAKLGSEGWEMVGVAVTGEKGDDVAYVFKRPK